jgi:hypothetical protein
MDPIQPIVPHAPNIPPIPPAPGIARVDPEGRGQGGPGSRQKPKKRPAPTPAAEPGDDSQRGELGEDDGLPHIDVTA